MIITTVILNAVLVAGCGQSARYLPEVGVLSIKGEAAAVASTVARPAGELAPISQQIRRVSRQIRRETAEGAAAAGRAPTKSTAKLSKKEPARPRVWVPEPLPGNYILR